MKHEFSPFRDDSTYDGADANIVTAESEDTVFNDFSLSELEWKREKTKRDATDTEVFHAQIEFSDIGCVLVADKMFNDRLMAFRFCIRSKNKNNKAEIIVQLDISARGAAETS